jgi:hypothetical protein
MSRSVEGVTFAHNSIWKKLDHLRVDMECLVGYKVESLVMSNIAKKTSLEAVSGSKLLFRVLEFQSSSCEVFGLLNTSKNLVEKANSQHKVRR